jgi:putative redox protein
MPKVKLDWAGGWNFDGYDSKGMPVDIDGTQQMGAKPSDLLPMALAACSATDLVMLLADGDGELESLSIEAHFTQQPDPPWTFQRVRMHYDLRGSGLAEADVAAAIERSENDLCSVAASLRATVTIESTFSLTPTNG